MRKFVVSDLHGNGNVYNSIMSFLENIEKQADEEIILYLNGDLIDRGPSSAEMLIDVWDRIVNKKGFKIVYLAGNHELMMYQAAMKMDERYVWPTYSNWFLGNGGAVTGYGLEDKLSLEEEQEIIKFVANLNVYEKLEDLLDDRRIVLVHAQCPMNVKDKCDLKVKDDDKVESILWTRKCDPLVPFFCRIGNPKYFSIVGHTPVDNEVGYEFYWNENYLNIDGGCAPYFCGCKIYDHVPLVEIDSKNNRLIILTFNNNNEIIAGNYFGEGKSTPISLEELNKYRSYLNKDVKVKKLRFIEDWAAYDE